MNPSQSLAFPPYSLVIHEIFMSLIDIFVSETVIILLSSGNNVKTNIVNALCNTKHTNQGT